MICDSNQEEPVRPRSHRVTAPGPLPRRSLLCAGHGAGVARCSPIIAPLPPFIVFLCLQSPWVRCDAQPVIPLLSTYSYSTPRSPSYISGRSQLPGPHLGKSTRSRPRGITHLAEALSGTFCTRVLTVQSGGPVMVKSYSYSRPYAPSEKLACLRTS